MEDKWAKTIVVTAGGTIEKIDGVRGITNFSSGTLGVMIADSFASNPDNNVILVRGKKAPLPQNPQVYVVTISDTESLKTYLENLFALSTVDVFIHAMAVSDYTVASITDLDSVLHNLGQIQTFGVVDVWKALLNPGELQGKVSSSITNPILTLKQTPKIIKQIKEWSPNTTLVGFKLLNRVPYEELINVATKSMEGYNGDYVVANDLQDINGEQHQATIISKEGKHYPTNTKSELASTLFNLLG